MGGRLLTEEPLGGAHVGGARYGMPNCGSKDVKWIWESEILGLIAGAAVGGVVGVNSGSGGLELAAAALAQGQLRNSWLVVFGDSGIDLDRSQDLKRCFELFSGLRRAFGHFFC